MPNDDDAKAILKRRARYVAMALAGVGTATQAACGPCLSASVDADFTDAGMDAASIEVGPCLSPPVGDTGPCLSPTVDVGPLMADADIDASTSDLDAPLEGIDATASDDASDDADQDAHIVDANVDTDAEDAP